ncbi:hypothetical protein DFP72DRAFT_860313 [Ephemerocybe angulata]|uniref:Uncharacterized protein n=1 Tax=Ephemerocybe angulata TaxID=980116 RepID=A0A8H6HAK2_9AGAR|nr:hypothetical protein DFP72DRAFT_860313 [Tulosesus angulatus]
MDEPECASRQEVYRLFKEKVYGAAKACMKEMVPKLKMRIASRALELKEVLEDASLTVDDKKTKASALEEEIRAMQIHHHTSSRDKIHLKYGCATTEKLNKMWIGTGKDKVTRDPILALRKRGEGETGLEFNPKRIAGIARDYHESLQSDGLPVFADAEEEDALTNGVLDTIGTSLTPSQHDDMARGVSREEVQAAIMAVLSEKASGVMASRSRFGKMPQPARRTLAPGRPGMTCRPSW